MKLFKINFEKFLDFQEIQESEDNSRTAEPRLEELPC